MLGGHRGGVSAKLTPDLLYEAERIARLEGRRTLKRVVLDNAAIHPMESPRISWIKG